ncbi:MAG: hypothetical protein KC486_08795 [Myxococcales bacterium]|jgi:hypothetical protein|nr:hypothetical protein [Myxococcales bacterium]
MATLLDSLLKGTMRALYAELLVLEKRERELEGEAENEGGGATEAEASDQEKAAREEAEPADEEENEAKPDGSDDGAAQGEPDEAAAAPGADQADTPSEAGTSAQAHDVTAWSPWATSSGADSGASVEDEPTIETWNFGGAPDAGAEIDHQPLTVIVSRTVQAVPRREKPEAPPSRPETPETPPSATNSEPEPAPTSFSPPRAKSTTRRFAPLRPRTDAIVAAFRLLAQRVESLETVLVEKARAPETPSAPPSYTTPGVTSASTATETEGEPVENTPGVVPLNLVDEPGEELPDEGDEPGDSAVAVDTDQEDDDDGADEVDTRDAESRDGSADEREAVNAQEASRPLRLIRHERETERARQAAEERALWGTIRPAPLETRERDWDNADDYDPPPLEDDILALEELDDLLSEEQAAEVN